MAGNAIEIEGLTKTYAPQKGEREAKTALKGVDLDIPQGSIFGLLGPNGAGKSTLINILAGLVTKTSGSVTIWGFDQDVNPRQSRAAIGVMPQELNLDPFFTPRGSLDVQAGLYGVPKSQRRTDEILELIGLSDKADAYSRALSGGCGGGSCSARRWSTIRRSSFSTSRRRGWTSSSGGCCGRMSASSTRPARRSS